MAQRPVVFIVDDDPDIRESLRWLVESVALPVETYASAQEFFDAQKSDPPGCLVVDVRMPGMSGLEMLESIRARGWAIPCVVVTAHGDVPTAVRAMTDGAVDVLEKPYNGQVPLDRVHQCLAHDAERREADSRHAKVRARYDSLSPREREVMALVVAGKSNKMVAREMNIMPKTVEVHRKNVMMKMRAESLAELVQVAVVFGLQENDA
ncbi:MAG: response regulator [Alphaproteobacteria bacterium]|nr:response regulator [Alphaproteobacteria bacterium]